MKPARFYAIAKTYFTWEIVAITTENGKHWWGRRLVGEGHAFATCHGKLRDLRGRFPGLAWAEPCLAGVIKIEAERKARRARLNFEIDEMEKRMDDLLETYISSTVQDLLERGEKGGEA
jgi:hypothetical protein